jgi:hypothetical protein
MPTPKRGSRGSAASAPGSVCRKTVARPVTPTGRSTEAPRLSASAGFALSDVRKARTPQPLGSLGYAHTSDRAYSGDRASMSVDSVATDALSHSDRGLSGRRRVALRHPLEADQSPPVCLANEAGVRWHFPALWPSVRRDLGSDEGSDGLWQAGRRRDPPDRADTARYSNWGRRAGGIVEPPPLHDVLFWRRNHICIDRCVLER